MTIQNNRFREIADRALINIYMDATVTVEEWAHRLGCDPDEIALVQEYQAPTENLEITQVMGLGRLGISGRSDFLQQRVDAVVNELLATLDGETAVFDFKKYVAAGDGKWKWFVDSRGINDLEAVTNLALVGTPCANLASMEAEFICTTGRVPKPGTVTKKFSVQVPGRENDKQEPQFSLEVSADPEFADYCHQRIVGTIIQAIGRLRANRRPGEKLRVFFLGDYPLPMPVMLKQAKDITMEAAGKTDRLVMAVRRAVQQLKEEGIKITQQAIADLTGYTRGHISRYQKMIISLLKTINSEMIQNEKPAPEGSAAHMIGTVYLPLLAEESPPEQVAGLLNAVAAHGIKQVSQAWSFLTATASIQLQTGLLLALPEVEFRQLATAV